MLVDELRRVLGPAEFADAVRQGAATRDATIVRFVQDEIRRLTPGTTIPDRPSPEATRTSG